MTIIIAYNIYYIYHKIQVIINIYNYYYFFNYYIYHKILVIINIFNYYFTTTSTSESLFSFLNLNFEIIFERPKYIVVAPKPTTIPPASPEAGCANGPLEILLFLFSKSSVVYSCQTFSSQACLGCFYLSS